MQRRVYPFTFRLYALRLRAWTDDGIEESFKRTRCCWCKSHRRCERIIIDCCRSFGCCRSSNSIVVVVVVITAASQLVDDGDEGVIAGLGFWTANTRNEKALETDGFSQTVQLKQQSWTAAQITTLSSATVWCRARSRRRRRRWWRSDFRWVGTTGQSDFDAVWRTDFLWRRPRVAGLRWWSTLMSTGQRQQVSQRQFTELEKSATESTSIAMLRIHFLCRVTAGDWIRHEGRFGCWWCLSNWTSLLKFNILNS